MRSTTRSLACVAVTCLAFALGAAFARAAEPAAPAATPEATPAEGIDPDAVALLTAFGKALEAQPRYSFAVDFSYDVVQQHGEKLEFGSTRVYTVKRPDHLRLSEERRVGGRREIYYDGTTLAVYVPDQKVYAKAKLRQHRDLDGFIDVVEEALGMNVALSDLLRAQPLARIEEGLRSAYIVGRETLNGVECEHVAWETDEVDAEAWFSTGNVPLLQRAVVDYREEEGRPSFRAQFTKWDRTPDVSDAVFVFTPPADAERVQFNVRGRNPEPAEEPEP